MTPDELWEIAQREDGEHGWGPGKLVRNGLNWANLERPSHTEYRNGEMWVFWLARGEGFMTTVSRATGWEVRRE